MTILNCHVLHLLRLREVTRLHMNHNPMVYLGEDSVSMAKLTHLYLSHMFLQDLSDKAFSQAPLLSHLDLSHNHLRYVEPFSGPRDLTSLNLTGKACVLIFFIGHRFLL